MRSSEHDPWRAESDIRIMTEESANGTAISPGDGGLRDTARLRPRIALTVNPAQMHPRADA